MPVCVLYSDENMEPITAFEVPIWALKRLREGERIEFAIPDDTLTTSIMSDASAPTFERVSVWGERFVRNGRVYWFLYTRNDVQALKLDSEWLSGQRVMAQNQYRQAFIDGFLSALSASFR